jgi:Zn-dependent M28 family amino/carboxypeptidase
MKISNKNLIAFCLLPFVFSLLSCNGSSRQQTVDGKQQTDVVVTAFNADSAYKFVAKQVAFGARVPNTTAHENCALYLVETLKRFGATVTEQKAKITAWDGKTLNITNVIGSFQSENERRILLFAHWDTRPWADHDANEENHNKYIDGANDGASGVGVLLEIARFLGKDTLNVGIDIIFFDAEDYGTENQADSWCLGTQYWAHTPHVAGYRAEYGILLDMVGAPNATFYRDQISNDYAPNIVEKVWEKAAKLNFGKYFINAQGGGIVDDHLYVNRIIKIPSIDIIDYSPARKSGFTDTWHTINDNMRNIDRQTLNAVGTTILNVICNE